MSEDLKGYLVVKVLEAAGQNGEDVKVWDDSVKEAFAKSKWSWNDWMVTSDLFAVETFLVDG